MIRKLLAAFAVMAMALVGLVAISMPASSVTQNGEVCYETAPNPDYKPEHTETVVDKAAHWQHYSLNGPPDANDPPAFPNARWQPNVEGDPHGIGEAGAYDVSHGSSGNVDWFYLEWVAAITHTVYYPAEGTPTIQVEVPCPPAPQSADFWHAHGCGTARVGVDTVGIPASWWYGVKITVNGADAGSAIIQGPGSNTKFLTFAEDEGGGEVTVKYWIHASTEWTIIKAEDQDLNYQATYPDYGAHYRSFKVDTDCEPNQPAPELVEQWHTWQTSLKPGVTTPEGGGDVTWPQTYVGAGQIAPTECGVWYQQDLYKGTSEAIAALYADGKLVVLDNGQFEDHALVKDWEFVYGGDCPAPEPSVTFSHVVPTCESPGSVTVTTADIPDSWWYGLRVEVDGVKVGPNEGAAPGLSSVAVQGPGTSTLPLTFTEDQGGGDVTVRYFVTDATEYDLVPAAMDNSATWPEAGEGSFVEFTVNTDCFSEQPRSVPVEPAVYTAPTCTAPGTLVGEDTEDYEWVESGFPTEATLTATPIGNVILTGELVFGPHDLTQLTGDDCVSEQPVIPEKPVVPTAPVVPTVVKTATLAETGFPLLGLLGLAGSFALIGGGLVNAGRLVRKSA